MSYPIPIENLYYLFCYAWNRLDEGRVVDVGGMESPELVDLFAKVLLGGVEHVLRRGIDRQYIEHDEVLTVVRGRISISESMMLMMRREPKVHCEFDELSVDILPNQVLKATLGRLVRVDSLHKDNARAIRTMMSRLREISDVRLGKHLFQQVQIRRHNAFYGFLMNVCELIYEATLPSQDGQGYRFTDILRDERRMALVFQDFVRNFLRLEQAKYDVGALQLEWDAIGDPASTSMLPTMVTDIYLSNPTEKIIVDTKYYSQTMQERFGKRSIHSDNLYQLFSYLKNVEARGPEYLETKGVLLYPTVDSELDVRVAVQGHDMRAVTLNLNQPWQNVSRDLRALFG